MAKRLVILAGHYGSGKTNIAVNFAFSLKNEGKNVTVCDLDIVNPYFRTKDSAEDFEKAGIGLISSKYANTNVDIPSLPQEMYSVLDDKETNFVLDIGGDDRGALALGRLAPGILKENSYEMLLVTNLFRPLTRDTQSLKEVMKEMETASGIRFTGVINNSNLGEETTGEDVLSTVQRAQDFAEMIGLPLVLTTVKSDLYEGLKDKVENLYPLTLQKKYY